jgi:hypothetical protein
MEEQKRKLAAHMLRELETPSKVLSSWENQFVESVTDQFATRNSLSDKQMEILERIYTEKTA